MLFSLFVIASVAETTIPLSSAFTQSMAFTDQVEPVVPEMTKRFWPDKTVLSHDVMSVTLSPVSIILIMIAASSLVGFGTALLVPLITAGAHDELEPDEERIHVQEEDDSSHYAT